jgi:hypothetical protein
MELNNDDVISINPSASFGAGDTTRVGNLLYQARLRHSGNNGQNMERLWFTEEGVSCEVLKSEGGGWQKGKIRFRLDFVPDALPASSPNSNSPLDDLRSNLDV